VIPTKTAEAITVSFGDVYSGEKPCIKWGPGSLCGKRHFQGHTCACREWSVVCVLNILNVVCKGAAVDNK